MIDTNNVELAAGTYTVTVGAGGRAVGGSGQNGGDSSIVFGEEYDLLSPPGHQITINCLSS